uniref:protein SHORT HYPOCOTYL IN WHITE LIGHT 1 n=1 Tax=Erigeron canadensis TaxID=72917 RepID=UPI001CB97A41|nr:protein SHORT HYPOCOTYL IN WHITE LIGHT 1 [Erigeron canadensis]
MATSSITFPSSSSSSSQPQYLSISKPSQHLSISGNLSFHQPNPTFHLQATRRPTNFPPQESENPAVGSRNWNRNITFNDYDDDDDDEDDDEEEEEDDRSLDLLIKFVENVFKRVSKRARKAVRSVLPINIPTKLVGFSVNGVLILAFFWILKAFLEVVCTLGSVVFVSILLVRGVWTGISYFQDGRYRRTNDYDGDNQAWTGTQPT